MHLLGSRRHSRALQLATPEGLGVAIPLQWTSSSGLPYARSDPCSTQGLVGATAGARACLERKCPTPQPETEDGQGCKGGWGRGPTLQCNRGHRMRLRCHARAGPSPPWGCTHQWAHSRLLCRESRDDMVKAACPPAAAGPRAATRQDTGDVTRNLSSSADRHWRGPRGHQAEAGARSPRSPGLACW